MLKIYNTLTRKKEIFKPLHKEKVEMYTCGPTVYWFAHVGNLRTYIFEDILKRVLLYNGYKVDHVMNITDVGHLTSDADTGEDKMEKGAKREKKNVWDIAEFYTKAFQKDFKNLNILSPNIFIKASDTIKEQVDFIQTLEKKGFTYKTEDGIYFDSSKIKTYGRLWPKSMKIKAGARVKMVLGKKNSTDFALWKFSPKTVKRQMEWDSYWGRGFPGWHTECVVMAKKYFGIPFDIHCGGIDHILIHHTNEIAQGEAAFGKILAKYWIHGEFLTLPKNRMGKSKGNIIILDNLIKNGFDPLSFRYLSLSAHYRSRLAFSLKILKAGQNGLKALLERTLEIQSKRKINPCFLNLSRAKAYKKKFLELINNDLNTPGALALMWEVVKNKELPNQEKYLLLSDFDRIFALNLVKTRKIEIPCDVEKLVKKREEYRKKREWERSDEIRERIEKLGYCVEDLKQGPKVKKL